MSLTITPGYTHPSAGLVTPTRLNTAVSGAQLNVDAASLLGASAAGAVGQINTGTGVIAALGTATNAAGGLAALDSSALAALNPRLIETVTVSATAATGTINLDLATQPILYYTSNASANFVLNFRASGTVSLHTALATGRSITAAFINTNGGTAYYPTSIQVDGTTTGVTTKWQGGTAPGAGTANSVDVYLATIIKTAATPTYTVLIGQTKF